MVSTTSVERAKIRQGRQADQAAVNQLWRESGLALPTAAEWTTFSKGDTVALVVAERADRIVGAAVATFDGWRAYVYHVAVAPDARHAGIGHRMMRTCEDLLRHAGARYVLVMIPEANTDGLALAVTSGYTPDGDTVLRKQLA